MLVGSAKLAHKLHHFVYPHFHKGAVIQCIPQILRSHIEAQILKSKKEFHVQSIRTAK